MLPQEMLITNPDGTQSPIKQEKVTVSKKTLGIQDLPSGSNATHLASIKEKVSIWVNRMTNGHLPNHTAWIAYKQQLWPGVRYRLGTMTNDLEVADKLLHDSDYRMLNVLAYFAMSLKDYIDCIQCLAALACSICPLRNLYVK
jgi:hypothetical protein